MFPPSPPVSEPLTNRRVLQSSLLQDILHPSHYLLNVLLQTANKLGISNKKNVSTKKLLNGFLLQLPTTEASVEFQLYVGQV
jgi:hypothetical protein